MNARSWRRVALVAAMAIAAGLVGGGGLAVMSCGDSEDSCSGRNGKICSSCGALGDCDITCKAGETATCVGLEFFGDPNPDDLRCVFCAKE